MRHLIILLLVFYLLPNYPVEAADFDALIDSGENHLYKWQIKEASQLIDEALGLADSSEDKARAYYLKSQLEFYKGNYSEAAKYGKEVRVIFPDNKEIGDFSEYASKIAEIAKEFKVVKTNRFLIKYSYPKDAALVGYAEKALEKAYFEIGSDLGIYPSEPIVVEIYPDPESFALASTLSQENIKTTGVIGICKFNRIMIISPRLLPKGYAWLDTLAHEYTHYLLFLKGENTVPVWLHEGIAKFEEKRWKEKKPSVISPLYETLLAKALKEDSLVPMAEMHPSFGKLSSAYKAQLAFAQVGTIVDFLTEKWGRGALIDLIEGIKEKGDHEAAIKLVTNMNFSEFYNSWVENLRARNLIERIPGVEIEELEFKKNENESASDKAEERSADLQDLDNAKARDYTRIGDMLKIRGRLQAAVYEYDKALSFDPISPVILDRMARVQTALGQYDKAEEKLSLLNEFYPDYVNTYINLGRIYLEKKNYKKAEEAYKAAISLNPFDPEAHAALISIYEKLNVPDLVESEKRVLGILLK